MKFIAGWRRTNGYGVMDYRQVAGLDVGQRLKANCSHTWTSIIRKRLYIHVALGKAGGEQSQNDALAPCPLSFSFGRPVSVNKIKNALNLSLAVIFYAPRLLLRSLQRIEDFCILLWVSCCFRCAGFLMQSDVRLTSWALWVSDAATSGRHKRHIGPRRSDLQHARARHSDTHRAFVRGAGRVSMQVAVSLLRAVNKQMIRVWLICARSDSDCSASANTSSRLIGNVRVVVRRTWYDWSYMIASQRRRHTAVTGTLNHCPDQTISLNARPPIYFNLHSCRCYFQSVPRS